MPEWRRAHARFTPALCETCRKRDRGKQRGAAEDCHHNTVRNHLVEGRTRGGRQAARDEGAEDRQEQTQSKN